MSEENKKEEKINFESLIKSFSLWQERFEKEGLGWNEQDWVNWGIDITDAIIDIYIYFKSIGLLINGLNKLLYMTKEENESENDNINDNDKKLLYS